ncbi:MAG: hypothetical protein J6S67_11055 [Methanobrevibacter sp.]|nr:hypothetical protein [Methanobrevibacter sp.]
MSLFDSLVDLVAAPVRCVGEIGKDLSSLTDIKKDEADGMLAIGTLGLSSVAKGVIKSLEKAGKDLDK